MAASDYRPRDHQWQPRGPRLFLVSSHGLPAYIWGRLAEHGETPLQTRARRYARTGAAFSFENACWPAGWTARRRHCPQLPDGSRLGRCAGNRSRAAPL